MGLMDLLLVIFLPFLASGVRKRGAGMVVLVLVLWLCLWFPGSIAGLILQLTYKEPQVAPTVIIQNYTGAPPTQE